MYYRARYYDPSTGRFLNEDPIGIVGGINLYQYTDNDPADLLDPSGLSPKPLKPNRRRYCTGSEVEECKRSCEARGKKYESCMVSQLYRIGPRGWKVGPEWIDGPVSCSCSDRDECPKAKSNPRAAQEAKTFLMAVGVGAALGVGVGLAPEVVLPLLPALPKLIPAASDWLPAVSR